MATTYFVQKTTVENYLVTVPNKAAIDDAITEGNAVELDVSVDRNVRSTTIKPSNIEQQMRRREVLAFLIASKEYDSRSWCISGKDGISHDPVSLDIVESEFRGVGILPRYVYIMTSRYTTESGDPRCDITMYCCDELPTAFGACGDYYDLDGCERHNVENGNVVNVSTYESPSRGG